MRLIDADEFEAILLKNASPTFDAGVLYALNTLDKAPTVDAVPVVRCKDCVHWDNGDCYRLELSRPNDFCSYGERKSDNE